MTVQFVALGGNEYPVGELISLIKSIIEALDSGRLVSIPNPELAQYLLSNNLVEEVLEGAYSANLASLESFLTDLTEVFRAKFPGKEP